MSLVRRLDQDAAVTYLHESSAPKYQVWTAIRGTPRNPIEFGYFASPSATIPPGTDWCGPIRWGPRGRRLAQRDACKLHKKWKRATRFRRSRPCGTTTAYRANTDYKRALRERSR